MKTTLPKVKLGRIELHEIEPSDYLDYFLIGKDLETIKTLNWGPFNNPKEALWTINNIFYQRPSHGLPIGYGIYLNHRLIGMIDYHTYYHGEDAYEIGYVLNRDYWGLGIMQKCLRAVIKIGFNYLGCQKLYAGHTIDNNRSKNTILACGFKYDKSMMVMGRNGMEMGYYYSIYKEEYEGGWV